MSDKLSGNLKADLTTENADSGQAALPKGDFKWGLRLSDADALGTAVILDKNTFNESLAQERAS